jgi:carbamoyltransferase
MLSAAALRRQLARRGLTGSELRIVDHHTAHAAAAAWASGFAQCAVLTIDGLGDGLSSAIFRFRDGRLERVAASPARHSVGVFFEHVTNLLNMRELEDEGKVMALADYAAPIADADNPLLPWVRVTDGVIDTKWPGHAFRRPLARVHWRFPNEQFAYLAQRTVEHAAVALARDAVRLTDADPRPGGRRRVPSRPRGRFAPAEWKIRSYSAYGRRRPGAGSRGECGRSVGETPRVDLSRLDLGPATIDPSSNRPSAAVFRRRDDLPCRVAELLADGGSSWFQGAMDTVRALGHAACSRVPIGSTADRLNRCSSGACRYQPFCPSNKARALACSPTGRAGATCEMAMAEVAETRARLAGV